MTENILFYHLSSRRTHFKQHFSPHTHHFSSVNMLRRSFSRFCSTTKIGGSGASSGSSRFVSPFKESGFDPAGAAVFQSSNPIQRSRRDQARSDDIDEEIETHHAMERTPTRDKELFAASQARQRARIRADIEDEASAQPIVQAVPPHEHHQQDIAHIRGGSFQHIEDYKKAALEHGNKQQLNVDLEHFLPLPDFPLSPENLSKWPYGGRVGLAIDVDGVLIRGSTSLGIQEIEGSGEALRFLRRAKIPFVLVTNGGGNVEVEFAKRIFKLLGVDKDAETGKSIFDSVSSPSDAEWPEGKSLSSLSAAERDAALLGTMGMVSHTPMRILAQNPELAERPVLVLGPPTTTKVLRSYGFKNPIHVHDLQIEHSELTPLKIWSNEEEEARVMATQKEKKMMMKKKKSSSASSSSSSSSSHVVYPKFAAVFVMGARGVDVFNDLQVVLDVVLGEGGQPGGRLPAREQQVPVYWSGEDFHWAGPLPLPRLGIGAMKEMFSSIFESVAGEPLEVTAYGKPRKITYLYAQELLRRQNALLYGEEQARAPDVIVMVGDNLDTDIAGANAMNVIGPCGATAMTPSWLSVQVMTGVGRPPFNTFRSIHDRDEEALWFAKHFGDPVPHYVAPTFRHFVGELMHFPEKNIREMQVFRHVLPNPVDVEKMYGWFGGKEKKKKE